MFGETAGWNRCRCLGKEWKQNMHMGKSYQVSAKVDEGMLASALGSGDVGVLATPVMLSLMEQAACACVQDCLKEGETTVGAQIDLAHISAVPAGMEITATAEIIKIEGKKVLFKIFCEDREGIVGKGTHLRLIVNRDKFQQRAAAKVK
ncbi:MAG: hypothetical protein DBX66_00730 [Clostridiales bacterium]|nr:MAG: hypothetical protein DBX66_00730 [Clostridiales bacterium]